MTMHRRHRDGTPRTTPVAVAGRSPPHANRVSPRVDNEDFHAAGLQCVEL